MRKLILCALLFLFIQGCGGQSGSAPTSNTAVPSAPTPSPISSSADVVKVITNEVSVSVEKKKGTLTEIQLVISPGYHVNANPATFDYLIPTELTPGKVTGLTAGKPIYPAAEKKSFEFAPQPLAVYEGQATIKLDVLPQRDATTVAKALPISVRVQACDHQQCYAPATLNASIPVTVK